MCSPFYRKVSKNPTNLWQRLKMAMGEILVIYVTGMHNTERFVVESLRL